MPIKTMRPLAALGAALLCGSLFTAPARAKDFALVVGVNDYPGITDNGVPGHHNLTGAVFDAKTFANLLETQFHVAKDDIHTMFDAQATHDAILRDFKTFLIDASAPGDRVFFFFAGHGAAIRVNDEETGASRMTSSIVPADAAGDLAHQVTDMKGLILGVEIKHLLEQIRDRAVLFVADACQSGSVSRGIGQPFVIPPEIRVRTLTPSGAIGMTREAFEANTAMRQEAKANSRVLEIEPAPSTPTAAAPGITASNPPGGSLSVWSAATVDQVTFDLNDRPGGIFTQSFAQGLRDKKAVATDGTITAGALLNYVRDEAKVFCVSVGQACSAGLTPQLVAPPVYLTTPVVGQVAAAPIAPAAAHEPETQTVGKVTAEKLTALLSHKNDFDLQATILPGPTVAIGQHIQFRINSAEAGKVAVFYQTPDGDLTQIFPNTKTGRTGTIRAHAPLTIPDAFWGIQFTASAPAGPGSLLVLVTENGMDLSKATDGSLNFKPLDHSSRLLEIIATEVQTPVVSPKLDVPTREARWAFVRVPYTWIAR